MEGHNHSLVLVRTLEASLADLHGAEFFDTLVTTLADALSVHCAFVTEFVDDNRNVQILAIWTGGDLRAPKRYAIAGTPCEAVLDGQVAAFPSGVIELFPEDETGLKALEAESFLAIPLVNRSRKVIGHIALMDNRPREWGVDDIDVLRLFATRAASEVERSRLEADLTETNRLLEARVLERTQELAAANERLLRQIEQEQRLSESLAENEAGFRVLFEHSPVSIWELDLSGVRLELDALRKNGVRDVFLHCRGEPAELKRILRQGTIRRFNGASLNLFGITDPRAVAGVDLGQLTGRMRNALADVLVALDRGAVVGERELRLVRRDGSKLVCMGYWSLPPASEASWSRLLVSFVDLTEQKRVSDALAAAQADLESRVAQRTAELSAVNTRLRHEIATRSRAEHALQQSEAAYRDLYENAPNVYWSTGADGLIRRANALASQLFGYSREEIINKPLLEMLADSPEGKGVGRRVFQRFLEGKATFGQEVEFRAADGQSVWADVNVVPIFDDEGHPVATRSMLTDVTARKRAQTKLAQRLSLDQMVLEVSTLLAGAGAASIRKALERALAIIGDRGEWDVVTLRVPSGDSARSIGWTREGGSGSSPPLSPEAFEVLATLDGPSWWSPTDDTANRPDERLWGMGYQPGAAVVTPLRQGNQVLGMLTMLTEQGQQPSITPEDLNTVALLADLLEATLARCAAEEELVTAKRIAESASNAKSDFLASMSHELRTPLNVILGYTQLLRRNPDLNTAVHDHLATVQRSGELLLQLIDDVLELARIEAGRLTVDPRALQLETFTGDLARMFGDRVTARGMNFRLSVTGSLPAAVVLDARRLQQVLINLLSNAVKFSSPGGTVTLTVSSTPSAEGWVELTFQIDDEGVGIAPADIGRIFEPFVQIGRREGDGVGLGLAITKTLVAALNGRISVTSTPGKGVPSGSASRRVRPRPTSPSRWHQ